jgi:hypothetical protein
MAAKRIKYTEVLSRVLASDDESLDGDEDSDSNFETEESEEEIEETSDPMPGPSNRIVNRGRQHVRTPAKVRAKTPPG